MILIMVEVKISAKQLEHHQKHCISVMFQWNTTSFWGKSQNSATSQLFFQKSWICFRTKFSNSLLAIIGYSVFQTMNTHSGQIHGFHVPLYGLSSILSGQCPHPLAAEDTTIWSGFEFCGGRRCQTASGWGSGAPEVQDKLQPATRRLEWDVCNICPYRNGEKLCEKCYGKSM